MKQSWILSAIFTAAFIFLTLQYFVFKHLSTNSQSEYFPTKAQIPRENIPNLNIRGRTILVPTTDSRLITTSIDNQEINRVKQLQVTLNSKNQPFLPSILPFFNIYNLKFKTTYVNEPITKPGTNLKSNFIRGIYNKKITLYQPDTSGQFKCIDSNQKIPYSNLNDDFCDCVDGTDEPGTSACQYSKFYCTLQNEQITDNFVVSSKVDDGICDCCDGSDESFKKCPNMCNRIIAQNQAESHKVRQGLDRKRAYLINGKSQDERRYGPGGVFFLLSKSCFKIDWSEYTFEVCPYHKVVQFKKHRGAALTNLGHISSLEMINKKWRLKISGGDPTNCGHARTSEIYMRCGLKDELISVQEPEKCLYLFEMSTPAAC